MSSASLILQFFAILLLIHSSITTSCGSLNTSQQAPNYRSWLVSIVYSEQQDQINPLQCSGTILNDLFVITAAHCLYDLNGDPVPLPMLLVQPINNVAINRSILKVYYPKEFNIERMDDDIVLLKLDRSFTFNSYVSPICFDSNILANSSGSFALTGSSLEPGTEMDVVNLSILPSASCNIINSLIFKSTYENSLCVGEFEASQKYYRQAGMALMIKVNDTMFIGGVVQYTTGSSQGNISFAGGINLAPYAAWIDKKINRHLRPIVSEQKCQEYSKVAINNDDDVLAKLWVPSVLLVNERMEYFHPQCLASLISEQFLVTAAQCKHVTKLVYIQIDFLNTERFPEFKFYTILSEPNGIALVKLPRKPRNFNKLIACLWTEEDTPVQFMAQVQNAIMRTNDFFFQAEYIPTKPIKLMESKQCIYVSSMLFRSVPGDVVALKRGNETLRRIVGLTTRGFGGCFNQTAENIIDKLDWIEGIVWGVAQTIN